MKSIEKIFKNYVLKSIDAVYAKLNEAIFYIDRNPQNREIHHVFSLYRQLTLIIRCVGSRSLSH